MNPGTNEGVRSIWRKRWFWHLYGFTSLKNQEELWLAKRPGEMQTFIECMCCYFDDTLHGQSLDKWHEKGFLSEPEVAACRKFHNLANSYTPPKGGNKGDDRMILADPKWHNVVAAAQDTWKQLRAITSGAELAIMNDCEKQQRI